MSILDDFEIVDTVIGMPTASVTKNGISFNKTVLEKLDCPEFVRALLDRGGHRLAIVPCTDRDKGARRFYTQGKDTSNGVRWNNYDLRTTIATMMGWNLEERGWKTTGTYIDEEHAFVFELDTAEPLKRK